MRVNRKDLRDKLSLLKPGLGKKELDPQETHFIFFDGIIATFNQQILITIPFESELENFSVKAEEFFRLVDGISDETLDIVLREHRLRIKSRSTTATISTFKPKKDPLDTGLNDNIETKIKAVLEMQKGWRAIPEELIPGMVLCSFSASPDLSSAVRACVCARGDRILSTDNARVSRFILPEGTIDEADFNIQARYITELAKFPVVEYCMTKRWVHFRTEDSVTFSCCVIEGSMPAKIERYFEGMKDLEYHTLPDEFSEILNSVVVLASEVNDQQKGRKTTIRIGDNKINIKAENELGNVEKSLPYEYDGEPIKFLINNNFLTQILQHTTTVAWEFPNLYFSSGNFSHLMVMLDEDDK